MKTVTTDDGWLFFRADGTIEQAEVPGAWRGRSVREIADDPNVPRALVEALYALLALPLDDDLVRRRSVMLSGTQNGWPLCVHIARIDAVPLRRAYTPLIETILRALDPLAVQATSAGMTLVIDRVPRSADDTLFPENDAWRPFTAVAANLDGEKIAWALATLVGNALRHGREGGTVHVALRTDRATHELVFVVQDDGAGIPEARLRHLFEHDPRTGLRAGLALVLVRDIVVAHGGSISVASGPANTAGTSFTIRIPRRG